MVVSKSGQVQPVVPRGQPHLPMRNRTMGNPAKLQDGVPVIMKVIDLMPCREAGGGGRILLMFQTAYDLQPGTMELCQASLQK